MVRQCGPGARDGTGGYGDGPGADGAIRGGDRRGGELAATSCTPGVGQRVSGWIPRDR